MEHMDVVFALNEHYKQLYIQNEKQSAQKDKIFVQYGEIK